MGLVSVFFRFLLACSSDRTSFLHCFGTHSWPFTIRYRLIHFLTRFVYKQLAQVNHKGTGLVADKNSIDVVLYL